MYCSDELTSFFVIMPSLKYTGRRHQWSELANPRITSNQYRSAIFYLNEEQRKVADAFISRLKAEGKGAFYAAKVEPATPFYRAEKYHQKRYENKLNART